MIHTSIAHTSEMESLVDGKFVFMMILVGMMTPKHPRTSNNLLNRKKGRRDSNKKKNGVVVCAGLLLVIYY